MNAIVVTNIGPTPEGNFTIPAMYEYGRKVGAAVEIINRPDHFFSGGQPDDGYNYLTFEKNQVCPLLAEYDRVLRLDVDVLITPDAEDVFSLYPDGFAAVLEPKQDHRYGELLKACKQYGTHLPQDEKCFNSGVLMLDGRHAGYFCVLNEDNTINYSEGISKLGFAKEQTLLNYRIRAGQEFVLPMDRRFNYIRHWGWDKRRTDGEFIHYAGISKKEKMETLKKDYEYFYG